MTSDASETPAARQQTLQQRNNRNTIEHILDGAGSSTAHKCALQGTSFTCNAEQDSQPSDVLNTMDFLMQGSTSTSDQDSSGDITGSGSAAPTVAESINVPVGSSTWEESASTAKFDDDDIGARDSQNKIAYYENRIAELERDVAKVLPADPCLSAEL
ncbi:hypothetical protein Pcinc_013398 [Petrolisthes cinctipes]|uniref:Uncharacterized protein n=1 Tax=Petrolisthes cinctipes TaxID=88211 RepID=A0AAE1FXI7_PETCI|nr:hypothetical protein Pcinc_013398 [Petrolisthes cinctipes]